MKKTYIWDNQEKKLIELLKREPNPRIWIIPDIKPYVDDFMDSKPIHVKSRQHRKQLLQERGLAIK
jgi:hypothetical protein